MNCGERVSVDHDPTLPNQAREQIRREQGGWDRDDRASLTFA